MNAGVSPVLQTVPFRLIPDRRAARLAVFNQRAEITWFGLHGAFEGKHDAVVRFTGLHAGVLGGGGAGAVNGGVIAAGFDAACVLAAIAQYDVDVVVTLTLQVQFLRLARASPDLAFRAQVLRSARQLCFVQAHLVDGTDPDHLPLAAASATLAPS